MNQEQLNQEYTQIVTALGSLELQYQSQRDQMMKRVSELSLMAKALQAEAKAAEPPTPEAPTAAEKPSKKAK